MLPPALEIIFEMYLGKGIMKKKKEINKLSNLQNTFFSFFFSLDFSYFQTS